jgi:hypothetical protein
MRVRLLQWRVDCSPICPLCNAEQEDDLQTFFTCSLIRESWAVAGLVPVVYNRLHNFNSISCLLSDGCMQEGGKEHG